MHFVMMDFKNVKKRWLNNASAVSCKREQLQTTIHLFAIFWHRYFDVRSYLLSLSFHSYSAKLCKLNVAWTWRMKSQVGTYVTQKLFFFGSLSFERVTTSSHGRTIPHGKENGQLHTYSTSVWRRASRLCLFSMLLTYSNNKPLSSGNPETLSVAFFSLCYAFKDRKALVNCNHKTGVRK